MSETEAVPASNLQNIIKVCSSFDRPKVRTVAASTKSNLWCQYSMHTPKDYSTEYHPFDSHSCNCNTISSERSPYHLNVYKNFNFVIVIDNNQEKYNKISWRIRSLKGFVLFIYIQKKNTFGFSKHGDASKNIINSALVSFQLFCCWQQAQLLRFCFLVSLMVYIAREVLARECNK